MPDDASDPWALDLAWNWIGSHAQQLSAVEGPEVARAFALSALVAEIAGVLALAVAAAQTRGPAARRSAWQGVAALAPVVRRAITPAAASGLALDRPLRRSTALVDRIADLAPAAPVAATIVALPRPRPVPPPDGSAPTLRRWYLECGAQPALELFSAAAKALPGLAPDCDAWAADLRATYSALGRT